MLERDFFLKTLYTRNTLGYSAVTTCNHKPSHPCMCLVETSVMLSDFIEPPSNVSHSSEEEVYYSESHV